MPFSAHNLRRLSVMGHVGTDAARPDAAKSIYTYPTDDTAAVVEAANYIPTTETRLGRGDVILVSMVNTVGGTPRLKAYVVTTGRRSGDAANAITLQATTAG